ncbi:ABC transporter permease [Nostocoides australiense]|uniref:Putative permease abc transporter protein n=1 Tax=Nostocoides australiense Ben110 TaxID=1193182 RepID=W6JSP7_9MICO|nr:ABC transporter permease [Tetrasphaera australiensis]MCA0291055.1 ABC transporter permease [Actinomycetota bacterium]MCB1300019.1 ABC transporter permease [Tetrasphaera sp.]CCH72068.1 putative permease abc transporter protein [Tetrasphaera australiensis Ben110]
MSTASSDAAAQFSGRQQSALQRVQNALHLYPWISPLVILILSFIAFTILNPRFATAGSMGLLIQQMAIVAALAIGQTLVILTAGIDLSVGAITVLAMMVMATLAKDGGMPGLLALIIGVGLATLAGLLNGILVTRMKLPPFIVTLGTLSIFTAIALLYSGGSSIQASHLPAFLNWLGKGFSIGGLRLTYGVLLVILLYAVVGFVLSQTAWGRHVYAVGDEPEAARLSGVPSRRVLLQVYTVAGFIYGIAAWALIGRSGAATPNAIPTANLDSITAVVIGGTSLFGGRGRLIGTLIGAIIVQTFAFGLSLAGVNQQWRLLAIGLLVIIAVSIDQWIRKVK